jgi:hypothetical protein
MDMSRWPTTCMGNLLSPQNKPIQTHLQTLLVGALVLTSWCAVLMLTCIIARPANAVTLERRLTSGFPGWDNRFGAFVGTHEGRVIVGETFGGNIFSGTVQLFDIGSGARVTTLRAADRQYIDQFGYAATATDQAILVGAPGEDGASSDINTDVGAAYVFDPNTFEQRFKLLPANEHGGKFGSTVAISDEYAIVGSRAANGFRGAVQLFDLATGAFQYELSPTELLPNERFGDALFVQHDTLIVGSTAAIYAFDLQTGLEKKRIELSGANFVMDRNRLLMPTSGTNAQVLNWDTGEEIAMLSVEPRENSAGFRHTALSGNIAVISESAFDPSTGGTIEPTLLHIFDVSTQTRLTTFSLAGVNSETFVGKQLISLVGNRLIVGAPDEQIGDPSVGAVYVYSIDLPLFGDTDLDGDVDLEDLNNVRNNFGDTGLGDTNADGIVDLVDLNSVRNHFGDTAPSGAVPEPGGISLAVIALCCCAGWRIRPRRFDA